MKFNPYKNGRGGGRKKFSHAEGGGGGEHTSFEVVLTQELEVLAILIVIGGEGAQIVLPCLEGGRKKFWTRDFFHFVGPPSP